MRNTYTVKSDRAQVVTGLGVFDEENLEQEFDEQAADGYLRITGLELAEGNVPEGVTVTKGESSDEGSDPEEVDEDVVPPEEQEIVAALKATDKKDVKKGGTDA